MAAFLDICRFNPTAGGTGDWTFSYAATGYQSPASANAVNGRIYKFRAEALDLSQWELAEGAYNASTGVFARSTVIYNSAGTGTLQSGAGGRINFSTVPQVAVVALKEDLISIEEANNFTRVQQEMARSNLLAGVADIWERIGADPSLDLMGEDLALTCMLVRPTNGKYFGSNGLLQDAAPYVPRISYDPVARQQNGFLLESAQANMFLQSQNLSAGPWIDNNGTPVITADAAIAPDGTLTADLIDDQNTAGPAARVQSQSITSSNKAYTITAYIKAGTSICASIQCGLNGGTTPQSCEGVINLSNGECQWRASATGTAVSSEPVGNGWYRLRVTITDNNTGANAIFVIMRPCFAAIYSNVLDNTAVGSAYVWGVQVEQSTFPSSYCPTAGAAVTRQSDQATIFTDDSWYNQNEGTFLFDMTPLGVQGSANSVETIQINNGSGNNSMSIRFGQLISGTDATVVTGGVVQADMNSFPLTELVRTRLALGYAADHITYWKDGATVGVRSPATVPPVDRIQLLASRNGGAHRIHRIAYWPKLLSDSQLQLLTRAS